MKSWRPSSSAATARRRADILQHARDYFLQQDVLSVDTPALNEFAGSDPNIESLMVNSTRGARYYLHTSPEFCMKRLLAAGYPDIYSICRVFRDAEAGARHALEFTMIEWYRLGFGLTSIVADTIAMIAACLERPALNDSVAMLDYGQAFKRFANIDAFDASTESLADCVAANDDLRTAVGNNRDTWLDLILSVVVAPRFESSRLTVLRHYPASQAALAQLCAKNQQVADRFEVFFGSNELANGYVELKDADAQRNRLERDLQTRRRCGKVAPQWDRNLIAALESGLPDCAGVAVGLERLHMIFDQTDDIRDVMTFSP